MLRLVLKQRHNIHVTQKWPNYNWFLHAVPAVLILMTAIPSPYYCRHFDNSKSTIVLSNRDPQKVSARKNTQWTLLLTPQQTPPADFHFVIGPIYTGDGSSIWDELGQRKVAHLIIHLCIYTGKQTDHLSWQVIHLTKQNVAIAQVDGWSVCLPAFIHRRLSSYPFLPKLVPERWSVFSLNQAIDNSSAHSTFPFSLVLLTCVHVHVYILYQGIEV